jgi:hypothetical protein
MSEPVCDGLIDKLCALIGAIMDEAIGDYLSHEQAEKLRKCIADHEES